MSDVTSSYVEELEALWQSDFPLNRSMRLTVADYKPGLIQTKAPLEGNTNTHGTAFAGSLYALQALSAWGLIWLELRRAGIDASIIHASGDIKFHAPLGTDIAIQCHWSDYPQLLAQLRDTGRIKFELHTTVALGAEHCAEFSGVYVVRKEL